MHLGSETASLQPHSDRQDMLKTRGGAVSHGLQTVPPARPQVQCRAAGASPGTDKVRWKVLKSQTCIGISLGYLWSFNFSLIADCGWLIT